MKYLRYGPKGAEKPGALDDNGQIRDLSGHIADIAPSMLMDLPTDLSDAPVVPGTPRLGVPVAHVGKCVCIGLNYSDHAAEAGMDVPKEPIVFMKATSALNGPNDDVVLPRGSVKSDWEVELAVIIGRTAKYVDEDQALEHVAGYAVFNDVSERAFQSERGGQWTKGKSCDTFGPMGPYLVTPDDVGDPQNLAMSLSVNGDVRQSGGTSTMVFSVAQIISYLSQMMTLHPGDVIATGTPPGVGLGMKPPTFLKVGDVMELTIAGLGTQRQVITAD
ncbi:MAG: fumarylacetoacetate hydrolase family protein [Pseudomonadota bacterium]